MNLPEIEVPKIIPRMAVLGFAGKSSTGKTSAARVVGSFLSQVGVSVEYADAGQIHRQASKNAQTMLAEFLVKNRETALQMDDVTDSLTLAYLRMAIGASEWRTRNGNLPGPVLLLSGRVINHFARVMRDKGELRRDAFLGISFMAADEARANWLLRKKGLPLTNQNRKVQREELLMRDAEDAVRIKEKYKETEFEIASWFDLWSPDKNDLQITSDEMSHLDEKRIIVGAMVEVGILPLLWR